jgi:hypothetical protein
MPKAKETKGQILQALSTEYNLLAFYTKEQQSNYDNIFSISLDTA